MWSQILYRIRPCVACDGPTNRNLCVLCSRAFKGPIIEISERAVAAHLTRPVTRQVLKRADASGHASLVWPWLPGLMRALPTVPSMLKVPPDDWLMHALAKVITRHTQHLAICRQTPKHLKCVTLMRYPDTSSESPETTVCLTSHP